MTGESRRINVLVVDDDETIRSSLKEFLLAKGCCVETSSEPIGAVGIARTQVSRGEPFDFILLDQVFPGGMSGLALFPELKSLAPATRFIMMTGYGKREDARSALKAGFHGYLFKPVGPEERAHVYEELWSFMNAAHVVEKLEEELKQGGSWLHRFVNKTLDVGISIVDRSFRLRYVNEFQNGLLGGDVLCPGICWVEYNKRFDQKEPCPWCPVKRVFKDGGVHKSTTISPSDGDNRFYEVTAFPIKDEEIGEIIAAAEVVRDCTEEMFEKCKAAIHGREEAFGNEMDLMLHRISALGFDRARLYITSRDPQYLECVAAVGEHGQVDTRTLKLDMDVDGYSLATKEASTICVYRGGEHNPDPVCEQLRERGIPWIEVPLKARLDDREPVFVGKLSLDNAVSKGPLERNREFWCYLEDYGEALAPVLAEARDYWLREERARQMGILRNLELGLGPGGDIKDQMKTVVEYAFALLAPDHCHIRILKEKELELAAARPEGVGRVREEVDVEEDKDLSVSAALANSPDPRQPQIWDDKRLNGLAGRLQQRLPDAAHHFRQMTSCGAFALMGESGLIGTLIVDSKKPYFFDKEKISQAIGFVNRAQVLVESNLRRESADAKAAQFKFLLDTIPSEVVVLDAESNVIVFNAKWADRVGSSFITAATGSDRFAKVVKCVMPGATAFDAAVGRVFQLREPERLVANFAQPDGKMRQMDVLISPFEKNDEDRVSTVLICLTDISERLHVEDLLSGKEPTRDLSQSLQNALPSIQEIFEADRIAVAEFISSTQEMESLRLWSVLDPRPGSESATRQDVFELKGVAELSHRLMRHRFFAVSDTGSHSSFSDEFRRYFEKLGIRSFLAAPIRVQGEDWGTLVVEYTKERSFDGRDVDLLQAAATQLGVIVLISQQMELRHIDQEIAREVSIEETAAGAIPKALLKSILEQANRLSGCKGGHIRTIDWFTGEVVMQVGNDPFMKPGRPIVRERLKLGNLAAGVVALTGENIVINDVRNAGQFAGFCERVRYGEIPAGRDDLFKFFRDEGSSACFPLIADNEVLGTFSLSAEDRDHFTPRRLSLLGEFTARAALALRAAKHLERLKDTVDFVNGILATQGLANLWRLIPEGVVKLFYCEDASVSSYNARTGLLKREGRFIRLPQEVDDTGSERMPTDEAGAGLTLFVAKTGKRLRRTGDEIRQHPNHSSNRPQLEQYLPSGHTKSVMVRRLETPGRRVLGVLKVENRKGRLGDLGFTDFDEALMDIFSTTLAVVIERLQLLESRDQAIRGWTHDLKQPLQAVRGLLDNLTERVYTLPDDEEKVAAGSRQVKLMDAMIVSSLEVAEGAVPYDRTQPTDLDTKALAEEALDVFRGTLTQNEWVWGAKIDPTAVKIFGDKDQLLRVLINLIENVLRHGYEPDGPKEVCVAAHCEGEKAILQVIDRGPGIPEPDRERVFDCGIHADPHRRGFGIGLAAVRLIAKAHSGDVEIVNRPDGLPGAVLKVWWDQEDLRGRKQQG